MNLSQIFTKKKKPTKQNQTHKSYILNCWHFVEERSFNLQLPRSLGLGLYFLTFVFYLKCLNTATDKSF